MEVTMQHLGLRRGFVTICALSVLGSLPAKATNESPSADSRTYPGRTWETRTPAQVGLDPEKLEAIALTLGGRGCIVRHGYVVRTWGDQAQRSDWMSSSKPLLSTLLFFAIQEGKVQSVNAKVKSCGWDLGGKDEAMTFHHLANMISGYARPEEPGAAWAYNDYAINLYRLSLLGIVFRQEPAQVVTAPERL
jgi:CubicO group peptidase (beta-lactamase class C family)